VALIEHGELQEAHPAFWAPFVVVGEGGPTDAIGERAIVAAPTQAKKSARKPRFKENRSWTEEIWKRQRGRGSLVGEQLLMFCGLRQREAPAKHAPLEMCLPTD
jgi:hypothetical protein